ncbi:MAG: tRNA lysidine(34) synthetase TilS [Phenylobacterium sp.]
MRRLNPELDGRVHARLDARLAQASRAPLAVALSGGGDSLALALMASDWARARGRPVRVLTVDHGLQPDSRVWTEACAGIARRLGAGFEALTWRGPYPETGVPAAARQARHRLLAEAARRVGARVLLMGHTADDAAETQVMRSEGALTPFPREWSPSPVWPEGRGVFILRPLLGVRRESLRRWLRDRGEAWVEDPANSDPRFARSRARRSLAESRAGVPDASGPSETEGLSEAAEAALQVEGARHGLILPRGRLRQMPTAAARRLVAAACLSAGGGGRPPRGQALDRLVARLVSEAEVRATLAGALVLANDDRVIWGRTAGEMQRQGVEGLDLPEGGEGVFDGRFEIRAGRSIRLHPLAGRLARLPETDRAALSGIPAPFRGSLPGVLSEDGVRLAGAPGSGVEVRFLGQARLVSACGGAPDERSAALLELSGRC